MRHLKWMIGLVAVMIGVGQAQGAGVSATATYTSQTAYPSGYEYNLTLTNTGTTPIETFWFGWIPGYDLLQSVPSTVLSPSGWQGSPVSEALGVSSVEWTTSTAPLQPGQSLSGFVLDTADSPSVIAGPSQFGYSVADAYVYSGAAFTSSGSQLTATVAAVPEPGALALVPGALLLLRRRSR